MSILVVAVCCGTCRLASCFNVSVRLFRSGTSNGDNGDLIQISHVCTILRMVPSLKGFCAAFSILVRCKGVYATGRFITFVAFRHRTSSTLLYFGIRPSLPFSSVAFLLLRISVAYTLSTYPPSADSMEGYFRWLVRRRGRRRCGWCLRCCYARSADAHAAVFISWDNSFRYSAYCVPASALREIQNCSAASCKP